MKFWEIAMNYLVFIFVSLKAAESSIYMSAWDAREPVLRLQRPHLELGNKSVADVFFPSSDIFSSLIVNRETQSQINEGTSSSDGGTDGCGNKLQAISERAANLTKCLLSNARPFRLCENCVSEYKYTNDSYGAIQNDANCSKALLQADTIDTIDTVFTALVSLWISGDCEKCFHDIWENTTTGEIGYNFTRDTRIFLESFHNLTVCFESHAEENGKLRKNICDPCLTQYKSLNQHFENMWSQSNGHVCMDLVDMMNYTRLYWTTVGDCRRPDTNATVLIIISSFMAFFTALLYLVCRFSAEIKRTQIFSARRMSARPQYGAIGQHGPENRPP